MARQRTNYSKPSADEAEAPKKTFVKELDKPVRVRTGPGTSFSQANNEYLGKGFHEIVEVSKGLGSDKGWGNLADGRGWVALDFVQEVSK